LLDSQNSHSEAPHFACRRQAAEVLAGIARFLRDESWLDVGVAGADYLAFSFARRLP